MKQLLAYIDVGKTDVISNPIPDSAISGDASKIPATFLTNAIAILIYAIGIAAVGAIVYGGILYVTSGGDPDKAARGRRSLTYGIIAVVLTMGVYLLYKAITGSVQTGNL